MDFCGLVRIYFSAAFAAERVAERDFFAAVWTNLINGSGFSARTAEFVAGRYFSTAETAEFRFFRRALSENRRIRVRFFADENGARKKFIINIPVEQAVSTIYITIYAFLPKSISDITKKF